MTKLFLFLSLFIFASCGGNTDPGSGDAPENEDAIVEDSDLENEGESETATNYDLEMVDDENREEFKENLAKIEKEHGDQWDFCTCVVKNDSINKAFQNEQSDSEFDRLSSRFDEIETHCKAFLVQSPNATPEERTNHEKKVKKCLKNAGL